MIVTNTVPSSQFHAAERLHPYFAAHKSLTFRMLVPGGKQPQLKGRLVVERDGVLQISSPSSQPWLDTNLALVRLAQSMDPDSLPIIYDLGVVTFWQRVNLEKSGEFGRCRRGDGRKLPGYRGEGGISPGLALPFLVFSAGSRWRWAFCETPCIC